MSRINEFNAGLWQWPFEVEKILIQIVRARMSYSSLRSYTITTCNLPTRCYKLEILQRLNLPYNREDIFLSNIFTVRLHVNMFG